MAMPAAADTKFCTASPVIWVRWLIVASPPYDCQKVLHEADQVVLNEMWGHGRHIRRVERERRLEPLQSVDGEEGKDAETQQRVGVGGPSLLARRVDAAHPIDEPFDGRNNRSPGERSTSP